MAYLEHDNTTTNCSNRLVKLRRRIRKPNRFRLSMTGTSSFWVFSICFDQNYLLFWTDSAQFISSKQYMHSTQLLITNENRKLCNAS